MKKIEIIVCDDCELPPLDDFTPEENATMLKIGAEYVLMAKKMVVGEKILHQLREEMDTKYKKNIQELEEEIKKGKIIQEYLTANGEERFRKEIEKMSKELEAAEKKMSDWNANFEQKMEKEVQKEVQREREHSKTLNMEFEKRLEVYKNMEEKWKSVCEYIQSRKSTIELGSEGEKVIQEMCQLAFRDMEGFEWKDVHNQTAKGDYHLVFKEQTILVDSKLYTGAVSSQERDKIKRDLNANEGIHFAWLVSMDTPIMKFDKGVFAFEWITQEKCVCYVNSIRKNSHPVDVIRSLYFVCKMLYENIILKRMEEGEGLEKQTQKLSVLENFKTSVITNLENYQKITKDRDRALKDLKEAFHSQDELVRISLNQSTTEFVDNHYSVVYNWWNETTQYCEGKVITSQQLWARFKKDKKEYSENINMESFKELLLLFVKSFSKAKGKNGKLEIQNVEWKI